jgi:DNA-directed RNA polymerase specialized sigma24 family protein
LKTLDVLLSRWVGEADESRADTAFQAYYSTAFPSLARHVQHRTGWDPASAEDIAQEALLRFFERAGPGRRRAVAVLRSAANCLTAPEHRALQPPQTLPWAGNVERFVGSITEFRPSSDEQWRATADGLWSRIVSLQRVGLCLIDEARRGLLWDVAEDGDAETDFAPGRPVAVGFAESAGLDGREIGGFARRLARELSLEASPAVLEQRSAGIGAFVRTVLTVVETLPRLRLPTNGYLFEIATTLFLDEIKRRRRRKRGGAPERTPAQEVVGCGRDVAARPFELVPDQPQADPEGGNWLDEHVICEGELRTAASLLSPDLDPVLRYESEEFLHRFYEYLRTPLARASRVLEEARGTGREPAEQYRVECVARKFSRMMAVLSMMGEGYTQEETARRVRLSRNQVKYILESTKQAYARFAADNPLPSRQRAAWEGGSRASRE